MDFSFNDPRYTVGATLQMSPDGAGNIGLVGVTAYIRGNTGQKTKSRNRCPM